MRKQLMVLIATVAATASVLNAQCTQKHDVEDNNVDMSVPGRPPGDIVEGHETAETLILNLNIPANQTNPLTPTRLIGSRYSDPERGPFTDSPNTAMDLEGRVSHGRPQTSLPRRAN